MVTGTNWSTLLTSHVNPEGIVITKHGKPVARIIPENAGCAALIGSWKGRIKVKGDLLSTGARWNAQS